ncbi:hypothetical protein F7725_001789 [Dissostichus mawsoni]|uniref:Lethal giant larvae homologue 2 domain-containing protein n=1 Tax=Dissostichus mawsoni TaxID=36200 RepID=A0A7J5Y0T4_DISMA|nr:hypothetical protein F7725_001789 [Dissostichus mawsoni]
MKKFRKVLDGLTTSSPGGTMGSPSSGSAAGTPTMAPTPKEIDIQETLVSENFQMCKTVRHGFPYQPTALAFDPVQKILAIGSRTGGVRILGRPGVDCYCQHESGSAVLQLQFLINEGALVTACADDTLHLWNLRQRRPAVLHSLKFNRERITFCHLPFQSKWLYVGTERGNTHIVNIESFILSGYVIMWNKAIELSTKTHPGPVVHLSDCPKDEGKLLIGFESGMIVQWDLRGKKADFRICYDEVSSTFHKKEKNVFLSIRLASRREAVHVQSLRRQPVHVEPQKHHQAIPVTFPHGKIQKDGRKESCKPILKVEYKTSRSRCRAFCHLLGGLSYDKAGRRPTLTIMHGKAITVLEMDYPIVEFMALCETPYNNEVQEPYAVVVLLEKDLIVSPVTCTAYFADCPPDLIPILYSIGAKHKKTGYSQKEWPIAGGLWTLGCNTYPEMILTGHADGSIKFWDASATHIILYRFSKYDANTQITSLELRLQCESEDVISPSDNEKTPASLSPAPTPRRPTTITQPAPAARPLRGTKTPSPALKLVIQLLWVDGEPPQQITSLDINSAYGLLAFGNCNGLAVVDYLQKTILLCMSTLDLYGGADPYQRLTRSPRRNRQSTSDSKKRIRTSYQSKSGLTKGWGALCLCLTELSDNQQSIDMERSKSPTSVCVCSVGSPIPVHYPTSLHNDPRVLPEPVASLRASHCSPVFYLLDNVKGPGRKLSLPTDLKTDLDHVNGHCTSPTSQSSAGKPRVPMGPEGPRLTRRGPGRPPFRKAQSAACMEISLPVSHTEGVCLSSQLPSLNLFNIPSLITSACHPPSLGRAMLQQFHGVTMYSHDEHHSTPPTAGLTKSRENSFSRSRSSSVSSIDRDTKEAITTLQFGESYGRKNDALPNPCLWVGTSLGVALVIPMSIPTDHEERMEVPVTMGPSGYASRRAMLQQFHGVTMYSHDEHHSPPPPPFSWTDKGTVLMLKGSVLRFGFLDCMGSLIQSPYEVWRDLNGPEDPDRVRKRKLVHFSPSSSQDSCGEGHLAVVCSERQAKVILMPSQSVLFVHNITESSFVLRADVVSVSNME